jgi:hypothetical protein
MSNIIDLQESTIASHWNGVDEGISAILENMQNRESWALDDQDDLRDAIIEWAAKLNESNLENIIEHKPDALIRIFAFMKSKRSLFLLHQIESKFPGITSELLLESLDKIDDGISDTRSQRILRDRLVALFRVDLLERIFSEDRSEKIKQAIRSTSEKYGGIYE